MVFNYYIQRDIYSKIMFEHDFTREQTLFSFNVNRFYT
jgi:hypothetical protein